MDTYSRLYITLLHHILVYFWSLLDFFVVPLESRDYLVANIVRPFPETCENVDCGPGKKCKMNKKNKPRCVCAPDCSNITWKGPVCGLDGKTYKDECALLKAKCKGVPELDVQYQGKCKSTFQSQIYYYTMLASRNMPRGMHMYIHRKILQWLIS